MKYKQEMEKKKKKEKRKKQKQTNEALCHLGKYDEMKHEALD